MTALIGAVFVASLLGSVHCAGMCGAFVAFAVAGDSRPAPSRAVLHMAYNGGRLITYTLLGALGGALGAAVDLGGRYAGVQRTAAAVSGGLMVGFGVVAVLRASGVRVARLPLPGCLQRAVKRGHQRVFSWPPVARAGAVGMLTTLLPCGWLYAFAITAAGTGDPMKGAATMAAFWLGTLPMLITLGAGVQALTGPLRARLPVLTSLLLVGVGVATVAGRVRMPAMSGALSSPVDRTKLVEHVRSFDSSEMPCCGEHDRAR